MGIVYGTISPKRKTFADVAPRLPVARNARTVRLKTLFVALRRGVLAESDRCPRDACPSPRAVFRQWSSGYLIEVAPVPAP